MLTSQPQNNSQITHAVNPTNTQVDKDNSDEANGSNIFGRAIKALYDIVTSIPKKSSASIKSIYNKIQESIHARKVRAMEAKNAANIAKAKAACPFTGAVCEDDRLKHNRNLVHTELLQKFHDIKDCNFSDKVLEKSPGHMKKAIAEADKKTAVTDHTKRDFQLEKQCEKLLLEFKKLEDQKFNLDLEIHEIIKKFKTADLLEDSSTTIAKELMTILDIKKAKMKDLEAKIESKEKALNNAFEAHAKHIGDLAIPLDTATETRKSTKPVTKEELRTGIAKAAEILTVQKDIEDFLGPRKSSFDSDVAVDSLHGD